MIPSSSPANPVVRSRSGTSTLRRRLARGPDQRKVIILQAADANRSWLTAALYSEGSGWRIDDFTAFEGEPPSGGVDEAVIPIDPDEIEFITS